MLCKDGIIGIGDYRSSKKISDGNGGFLKKPNSNDYLLEEDKKRIVNKVFVNDNYIIITIGANNIRLNNINQVNLEDYLEPLMEENFPLYELVNKISEVIYDKDTCGIGIGLLYKDKYIIGYYNIEGKQKINFSNNDDFLSKCNLGNHTYIWGGTPWCRDYMVSKMLDGQDNVNYAKEKISYEFMLCIEEYNKIPGYHAVGLQGMIEPNIKVFPKSADEDYDIPKDVWNKFFF